MKRAVAALLSLLLMFSAALAEVSDEAIEIAAAQEEYLEAELPEETLAEFELIPAANDAEAPAEAAGEAAGETAVEAAGEGASQAPAEQEKEVAPTVLSYKKNKSKTVYLGTTYQFVVPGKKVKSYKSSAKKVAKVNSKGIITLKKTGKAKITAKLKNGKKVVLTLTVADPLVPAKVKINEGSKATLNLGDTLRLTVAVSPKTAPQDVTWKSSNKRVATVSEAGDVTIWSWGKTTLTASTANKKTAEFTLTVKKPASGQYMISHAMGGIDDKAYGNCLEAFLENYAEGHRVFEADFEYTSDGELVLCHDWNRDLFTGQKKGSAPTFEKFMGSKIFGKYTPMSLDDLLLLMAKYPDVVVITDTKYTDTATIKKQFKAIVRRADALGVSDVLDRLTVEIYNDKMFTTIEKIHHFDNYVYTLYKRFKKAPSKSDLKSVAAFCQKNGIGTIAMYAKWWKASYMDVLNKYDLDASLYTTNSKSDAKKFFKQGVTALFTDTLPPLKK